MAREIDASPAAAPSAPRARNLRVETLRLIAIAGIAVFHTFQGLFTQAVEALTGAAALDPQALAHAVASGDAARIIAAAPAALALLGLINLLGTFGNQVFFAISGRFLIPAMAARAGEPGYWREAYRKTARRLAAIAVSVACYAVLALAMDALVFPLPGIGLDQSAWIVGGLQFVWVYAALAAAAPVLAWAWRRLGRYRLPAVAALAVAVYAVNAYIAFVSPGELERGLLEWRKLMSAVSYAVGFVSGAALGELASSTGRRAWRRRARWALASVALLAVAVEVAAAWCGRADILQALSFKSTSVLSFALALAALAVALDRPGHVGAASPMGRLSVRLAPAILGFYILQSFTYSLWRPYADGMLRDACLSAMGAAGTTAGSAAFGIIATLTAGALFSFTLLAATLAVDLVVRLPLLRALRLK